MKRKDEHRFFDRSHLLLGQKESIYMALAHEHISFDG